MKLVTNDYGCGTSSSILDYGIKDVIVVSEENFEHIFEVEDDLLFIGHDFLFYLWDSDKKLKRWSDRSEKFEHWLWCFERVDAIVPEWRQKSHVSISIASKFCTRILACDEDDCEKYKFDWLPQWASKKFYDKRSTLPSSDKVLFSGQAGGPEYHIRNVLLSDISNDPELSAAIEVTNTKRSLSWEGYVDNFLRYSTVLNPVGILRGLNTRAYEALYSGRLLLQHTAGDYKRHEELLKDCRSVVFFKDIEELKNAMKDTKNTIFPSDEYYTKHSLYSRMKNIGVDIK